jgi:ribosomal protein S12 methylthiotransferase accessory factor
MISWEIILIVLALVLLTRVLFFFLTKQEPLLRLTSSIKGYSSEQDRVISPKETVKEAIERLKKMYDLSSFRLAARDNPIPDAFSFSSISDQFNCSGKGLTADQSQASTVMEFAERYSWYHFDYKQSSDYKIASYQELKNTGVRLVPPSYFLSQDFAKTTTKELLKDIYSVPLIWVKAISLTRQNYYYYPINWHNITFGSNGLGGGNTLEEAIRHALCEVIERENLARFFIDRQPARDLEEKSIQHPLIKKVLAESREAGITFVIKDISFDLGVPTFIACGTSKNDAGQLTYQGCGQGTHPEPEKALIRAISEYFESYSLMKQAQKQLDLDFFKILKKAPPLYYGFLSRLNPELLAKGNKKVRIEQLRNLSNRDIKREIEKLLTILKIRGWEVIVMNKTNPQLGIPAVRILVPGMRNPIGFEPFSVYGVLAQTWHEAGDETKALCFFKQYIKHHYLLYRVSESYNNLTKLDTIYTDNYRDTAIRFVGFKKNSTEFMAKIQKELGDKFPKEYRLY